MKKRKRVITKPKGSNAPKVARGHGSSAFIQETRIARLTRQRDDALEQLSATCQVLNAIGLSRGELKPAFQTILENATRICDAACEPAWNKDPVFGVIGIQSGPRG